MVRFQICFGSTQENNSKLPLFKTWQNLDQLYLESNLIGNFNLDIFDLTEKNILSRKILLPATSTILLPELNESIYLVRLSDGKQSYANKIVYHK